MVSLHAHNGIYYQHTRVIILYIVFDLQLIVVVSTSQSTKHRVTLFPYVVLSSPNNSHLVGLNGHIQRNQALVSVRW